VNPLTLKEFDLKNEGSEKRKGVSLRARWYTRDVLEASNALRVSFVSWTNGAGFVLEVCLR